MAKVKQCSWEAARKRKTQRRGRKEKTRRFAMRDGKQLGRLWFHFKGWGAQYGNIGIGPFVTRDLKEGTTGGVKKS